MPATKVPSGTRMKRWTIKGKLGEGAFGEVYGGESVLLVAVLVGHG